MEVPKTAEVIRAKSAGVYNLRPGQCHSGDDLSVFEEDMKL